MKIRRIVGKVLRGAFACAMGCIGIIGVAGCGSDDDVATYYGPPPACDSDDDAFWQVCNGDKASEAFRTCVDRYKKDLGCDENAVYYGPPSCTDENAFEQACANETDAEKRAACIKKMKQQAGCEEDEQ